MRLSGTICLLFATIVSVIMTGRIVYRTAGMALASRFDTPFADQWDQIPFLNFFLEGNWAIWPFWAQHNEHRIPLFRLLYLADGLYFSGTGQALLIANWAMAVATAAVLAVIMWHVPTLRLREKPLGLAIIVGCVFSSAQIENLVLPIGSTNLGVYLFGAATFAGIAYAVRAGGSGWRWVVPASMAFLGTGSLVSGLLLWPLAWLMLLVAGASRRLLVGWILLSGLVAAVYINGYLYLGHPADNARNLALMIDFLLVYFGGPFSSLGLIKSAAAGITVVTLFTSAITMLRQGYAVRHRAAVALIASGLFIIGTSLLTASGRANFGLAAAQAGRYQTPVLMFWSVALLLLLSVSVPKTVGSSPLRVLQLALPIFALFCLMRVEPAGAWALSHAYQIRQTGVAVALGITDPPNEFFGGVPHERVWVYRPTLEKFGLSMFADTERLGLGARLSDRYTRVPSQNCIGSIDNTRAVQAPQGALGVTGWAWDQTRHKVPRYIGFTDASDTIVGWAETGGVRTDVEAAYPRMKHRRPGFGGYALVAPGQKLDAFVLDLETSTACQIAL